MPELVRLPCLLLAAFATACTSVQGGNKDGKERGNLLSSDIVGVTLAAASLPLSAVNSFADWKEYRDDVFLPWVAPEVRVKAFVKNQLPTAFDMDTEEYRWRVGDDWVYPFDKYNPGISDFIVADPISRNWEFSGERVRHHDKQFSRPELMPDYDFYLVSIKPTVVVMVPTGVHRRAKYLPAKRQKLTDWGAIPHKSIKYSTRFPAPQGRQPLWFSPDLRLKVRPVALDQVMEAGRLRLTCTRNGDTAECRRTAP